MDHDLEKICSFYQLKELEIYGEVDALLKDAEEFEADNDGNALADGAARPQLPKLRSGSIFKNFNLGKRRRGSTLTRSQNNIEEEGESDDDNANEHSALRKTRSRDNDPYDMTASSNFDIVSRRRPSTSDNIEDQAFDMMYNEGVTLKKRSISLYVNLCELRSFIQLNKTGFAKVLKKYDKIVDRKLKSAFIKDKVDPSYPFLQETLDHLNGNIERIEQAYADIVTNGDINIARRELRLHLREHVVWERNTVWREMIGIERKAQAANMGIRQTMLGGDADRGHARLQGDEPESATKEVMTPIGRYRCPRFLLSPTFYILVALIAIFAVLLLVPIMEKPEQQNCLALVVFVSLLWATEVFTTLLLPSSLARC